MPFDDTGTGSGRRVFAHARDTIDTLFTLILELQQRHYAADGLTYALSQVIEDLHNTPGPSQYPAVLSAQTLTEALADLQADQLATLERLELSRFGGEGRAA
eukprot:g1404.t1